MYIYIIIFLLVCILTKIGEIGYKKNKWISYIMSFISIMILSTFAAVRDLSVGTDVLVYGENYFESVGYFSSLQSYLSNFTNEKLYFIVNYVVYQISDNIHVLFFIFQFFIATMIYYIAYKDYGKMWLYVFSYLFLIYNSSFNILRQILAIIIVLFAFRFIEENKIIKYCLFVLLASFFHSSAVLCFIIPCILYISKKKHKYLYTIIVSIGGIILLSVLDNFVSIFSNYSLISDKYLYYINNSETNFNLKMALVKAYIVVGIIFFSKKTENKKANNLLLLLTIFDLLLFCSSNFIKYGYRMSYYILPHMIWLIPRIEKDIQDDKVRNLYKMFIITALILYWFVRYVVYCYDGTVPYVYSGF